MTKKKLKEKLELLEIKNNSLQQEVYTLQRNKEINLQLYNTIKAILKTIGTNEIEILDDTIEEVKNLELYTEKSFMKFATWIKLIDCNKKIKINEFD